MPDPGELTVVWEHRPRSPQNVVAPANLVDWQDNQSFTALAGHWQVALNLGGDAPEEIQAAVASAGIFRVLGLEPLRGRFFDTDDVAPGAFASDVVVLSEAFWRRRFGGDPAVVGRTLTVDSDPMTVVGVAPDAASLLRPAADLWLPTTLEWADRTRSGRFLEVVGRRAPRTDLDTARAELAAIAGRLEEAYPDFNAGWGVHLVPLRGRLTGGVGTALWVLLGAVGLLLIACANIANLLLLARAAGRRREMAVRTALGARRSALVRQLLVESAVLALAGAAVGVGLAAAGTRALIAAVPADLVIPRLESAAVDGEVLAFTVLLALATALFFGLLPALGAAREQLASGIRSSGRASGSSHRARLQGGLAVAEIALALVLVIGAGLLLRSFAELRRVDPGLDVTGVLTARISLSGKAYREEARQTAFFERLLERVAALPEVESAGAIQWLPLTGDRSATSFVVEGRERPEVGQEPVTDVRVVTAGYFETVGMKLETGRLFDRRDRSDGERVTLINRALAERHWPGEDPVGKRLSLSWGDWLSLAVVGVVGDVHFSGVDQAVAPAVFLPLAQMSRKRLNLVIRSALEPAALASAVSRVVREIDPALPVANLRTLREIYRGSVAQPRLQTLLLGAFSLLALMLAAVGVYGLFSYSTSRRVREFGVRIALGARRGDVALLVVRRALALGALGVALGLPAAFGFSRLLESLLFGVGAGDPLTYALVPLVLLTTELAVGLLPAWRAATVEPTAALREE